tara:strand:+ start:2690 stop:3532 length:843 start_codon:yes stop_codon:yes gene_type:complete
MLSNQRLKDRVALVTGGARGVGEALAHKLADEGAKVVVGDLDAEPLEAVVASIKKGGGEATALAGDVTKDDYGDRAVACMLDSYGGLDILINNAGYIWNSSIHKTEDEQWQAMLDVHVTAPFRILRAAAPFIRNSARAEEIEGTGYNRKVVNISSISGLYGAATQIGYSAGKAALVGVTRTLAKEWGRYRVNVNAVAFGFIETRLTRAWETKSVEQIDVGGRSLSVGFTREARENIKENIPLGRAGTPEEAAGAVFLFCTRESDYISGEILVAGGGLLSL